MKTIEIETYTTNRADRVKAKSFVAQHTARNGKVRQMTVTAVDFGDEGIFLMQYGAMIKAHYSAEDIAEIDRLNAMVPVADGEVVQDKNGKQYTVKINGDFSDAGHLIPVA